MNRMTTLLPQIRIACFILLSIAPSVTFAAQPNTLTEKELSDGWIQLFDGQTLFGWQPAAKANWQVADGAIVVSEGEVGLLHTTTQFADYELQLDFRSDKGTNSGVFLRTAAQPKDALQDCYELNIADDGVSPFTTGGLVGRQKAVGKHDSREWQSLSVRARAGKIDVRIDGQHVLSYIDPKPLPRGFIGLQHNHGQVAFRNIKLKPLGMKSIFNGKDLTGWKQYPEMKSRFTVTEEGNLNVRDGRGQLETVGAYGDFVLQLECISHAKGLNGGIFFRCIPGDVMMGYECQIHNGFQNGDRTKPEDCGTGGIFRRQDARRIVADDLAWFHMTIVADGPHMAGWVNGYQVSDWTDDRKEDENPRRGQRTKPGTLMIQGHDPTTNLSFRNLAIMEMPKRDPASD